MNLPAVTEAPCATDHPGGDDSVLILKPELLVACAGQFTFKAFLVTSAGEEEVTDGLTFASLSETVVTIDAVTGLATLLVAGVATISVTDGTRTASASVEVVSDAEDCCADRTVATLVLIDNSVSMSSITPFYPGSRLSFAEAVAIPFMNGMRLDKDVVGLARFNLGVTSVQAISSDLPTEDTVSSIPQSVFNTDLLGMLTDGIQALSAVTADYKVLAIFSDGEHCKGPESAADWYDILLTASNFKASGGIIVCCGCAASGNGFDLLQHIASSGYFLNPTDEASALDAGDTLVGLLCYYCGGLPGGYGFCLDDVIPAQVPIDPALPLLEY